MIVTCSYSARFVRASVLRACSGLGPAQSLNPPVHPSCSELLEHFASFELLTSSKVYWYHFRWLNDTAVRRTAGVVWALLGLNLSKSGLDVHSRRKLPLGVTPGRSPRTQCQRYSPLLIPSEPALMDSFRIIGPYRTFVSLLKLSARPALLTTEGSQPGQGWP